MDAISSRIKILILLALLVLGAAFFALRGGGDAPMAQNAAPDAARARATTMSGIAALDAPNPLGEIAIGDMDAPIVIVEYASLTCVHCGAFHAITLPLLREKYIDKGLVRLHVRPFALNPFDTAGNMLAHCVAPTQAFGFLELIFARQQQILNSKNPQADLIRIARQAGLSEDDYIACLKDQGIVEKLRAAQQRAIQELGVNSTPTFFINGRRLEGNHGIAEFEKIIVPLLPTSAEAGG